MVKQGEAGLFSIVYIYYIYAFVSLFYTINSMSDVVASTATYFLAICCLVSLSAASLHLCSVLVFS